MINLLLAYLIVQQTECNVKFNVNSSVSTQYFVKTYNGKNEVMIMSCMIMWYKNKNYLREIFAHRLYIMGKGHEDQCYECFGVYLFYFECIENCTEYVYLNRFNPDFILILYILKHKIL